MNLSAHWADLTVGGDIPPPPPYLDDREGDATDGRGGADERKDEEENHADEAPAQQVRLHLVRIHLRGSDGARAVRVKLGCGG